MAKVRLKAKVWRFIRPFTATACDGKGSDLVNRLEKAHSINDTEKGALEAAIGEHHLQSWMTTVNKGQKGMEMNIVLTFPNDYDADEFKKKVKNDVKNLKVV